MGPKLKEIILRGELLKFNAYITDSTNFVENFDNLFILSEMFTLMNSELTNLLISCGNEFDFNSDEVLKYLYKGFDTFNRFPNNKSE